MIKKYFQYKKTDTDITFRFINAKMTFNIRYSRSLKTLYINRYIDAKDGSMLCTSDKQINLNFQEYIRKYGIIYEPECHSNLVFNEFKTTSKAIRYKEYLLIKHTDFIRFAGQSNMFGFIDIRIPTTLSYINFLKNKIIKKYV